MPSISGVGNISPVSTTTILPSYSTTVMFLPISPRPAERQHSQLRRHRLGDHRDADSLERLTDRRALLGVGLDQRQPQAAAGIRPVISSAALSGIGLVVTRQRLVAAAAGRRRSRAPAPGRRAWAASHISRICGPTRCEATRMPPAPPSSSVRRKTSSLPARSASPSIGCSSSLLRLLDRDHVVDLGQLGELLGRHVDHHPRGDVVGDQGQVRERPRRSLRSGPGSRPGWACCSRA